jgi:hypothetical protein
MCCLMSEGLPPQFGREWSASQLKQKNQPLSFPTPEAATFQRAKTRSANILIISTEHPARILRGKRLLMMSSQLCAASTCSPCGQPRWPNSYSDHPSDSATVLIWTVSVFFRSIRSSTTGCSRSSKHRPGLL